MKSISSFNIFSAFKCTNNKSPVVAPKPTVEDAAETEKQTSFPGENYCTMIPLKDNGFRRTPLPANYSDFFDENGKKKSNKPSKLAVANLKNLPKQTKDAFKGIPASVGAALTSVKEGLTKIGSFLVDTASDLSIKVGWAKSFVASQAQVAADKLSSLFNKTPKDTAVTGGDDAVSDSDEAANDAALFTAQLKKSDSEQSLGTKVIKAQSI